MTFTVVGSSGFIGSALAAHLEANGEQVFRPSRNSSDLFDRPLGHVVYAAGITADFRTRPFDTLRANTSLLAGIMEKGDFASLLYLSSARIYRHAESSHEDAVIFVNPGDPEDLYDLTKLTAEALCHASRRSGVRVVRLTNVVGPDARSRNFLFDIVRSACDHGQITLRTAADSVKDYVLLDDVVEMLPRLATSGTQRCYNLGAGRNLAHSELVEVIVACTGARWRVAENAPATTSRPIDIGRLQSEFDYQPRSVLEYLPTLIASFRNSS